ncbi:patatin-like phospholipase family protein [Methylobacterium sp. WL69]|uniref:patatin-like phospholipase family protein n=1 Tax=Methylobacterium sp. WL69 TaxID=2603893 RepID=UPI0011C90323|nr:patatin-like phospholipase family protein [Methylobacterium sp. WL69]TXM74199.1 patatin-like phospholipase family protein [Methylobacterium sp. WL69]
MKVNGKKKRRGLGLCMSGGGFRATLFHAGALVRLNELAVLPALDFVSSVSGGSIAAGILASRWGALSFEDDVAINFEDTFLNVVLEFCRGVVDAPCIAKGLLSPSSSVADHVARTYDRQLFHGATLQDLPDKPRFVFCASNLSTGSLFRFSKRYLADYRLGRVYEPRIPLATAVAASSAFPPPLSPLRLDLRGMTFECTPPLAHEFRRLRSRAVLTDGGVYDNHGLEPLIKRCRTVLVSDGGAPWGVSPAGFGNWYTQIKRVAYTTDNQVRALRRRDLIGRFKASALADSAGLGPSHELREQTALCGAYWSLTSDVRPLPASRPIAFDRRRQMELAAIGTRLRGTGERDAVDLVNWGYLSADANLRSFYDFLLPEPKGLPLDQSRRP